MPAKNPTNYLIDAMLLPQRRAFVADLQPMDVRVHDRLAARGRPLPKVFFPVGAVISSICASRQAKMDVRGVGREGMLGVPALLATEHACFDLVCQIGGSVLWMGSETFADHLEGSSALRQLLSTYSAGVLTSMMQSIACNGLHSVAQRCARWLLVTRDRVGSAEFMLTHELLARMLGVRRSGVTVAVQRLAGLGLVQYRSGRLRILNARGLESESCDCYRVIIRETRRLGKASTV